MLTTEKCGTLAYTASLYQKISPPKKLAEQNKILFEATLWFPTLHETGVVLSSACSNRSHTKFHMTDEVRCQQATQTESV